MRMIYLESVWEKGVSEDDLLGVCVGGGVSEDDLPGVCMGGGDVSEDDLPGVCMGGGVLVRMIYLESE